MHTPEYHCTENREQLCWIGKCFAAQISSPDTTPYEHVGEIGVWAIRGSLGSEEKSKISSQKWLLQSSSAEKTKALAF